MLAITGPLLRRGVPRARVLLAAAIVSAGAALVEGIGATSLAGFLYALGALAGEAAFSVYLTAVAALILIVSAVALDGRAALPLPTGAQALAIGYLGLAVTAGAFIAWYAGLARLGVERAGLFAGLIPISTVLSPALIGTGTLSPLRLAGATLVGLGVVLGLRTPAGDGL